MLAWPMEARNKHHETWWGKGSSGQYGKGPLKVQMIKALLQCFNPLGRTQEMTLRVSLTPGEDIGVRAFRDFLVCPQPQSQTGLCGEKHKV